ncbi:MAG: ABC transporter permease subunit [bacterium]
MLKQVISQKVGLIGLFLGLLVLVAAVFAPLVSPYDPYRINMAHSLSPPSLEHPLGTDVFGRDVLSRMIYGARISMEVSVLSRLLSLMLGTLLGLVAGYFGGRLDNAIMRTADVTLAYPGLLLLIAVMAAVGPSLTSLIIALGIVGWAATHREFSSDTCFRIASPS